MQSPIYLFVWVTAICAAGLIWSFGLKRLALDVFRERLFELRFQLFSLGAGGELSYDDPAYRSYEILICGLLRYAHRISFVTYCVSLRERNRAMKDKDYVDLSKLIDLRVSRLQPPTQAKVNRIAHDARTAIILYFVFSSLPLAAMVAILYLSKKVGLITSDGTKEQLSLPIEREAYWFEARNRLRPAFA